jgi:acyl-CoA thioesterase-2
MAVLLDTLDLEQIDRDIFRGYTPPSWLKRTFGGQVAAQALVAAIRTVPDQTVHSLHAYFLRPGQIEVPIVYEVDRIRDGRSYTTRRVVGLQGGKAIFNLQASFQVEESGYEYQLPMPPAAAGDPSVLRKWGPRFAVPGNEVQPPPGMPFELRLDEPVAGYERLLWFRTTEAVVDDANLHRCIAAYASDLTLLSVALEPLDITAPPNFVASLDHAMWFHRSFRVDDWLLYAQTAASVTGGRGLAEGRIFTRDGRMVVSVVQEGALRP